MKVSHYVVRILLGILFYGIGIFLFAEAILAVFHYPKNLPQNHLPGSIIGSNELGWRHVPGKFRYFGDDKKPFEVTYLQDGSRASNHVATSPHSSLLLLGCSFIEGFGLGDYQTAAWKLQEDFPDTLIKNMAVGGYGTIHNLLQLNRFFEGQPAVPVRVVVYGFADFHLMRNIKNPIAHRYWSSPGIFPFCGKESCTMWAGQPGWKLAKWSRLLSLIENAYDSIALSRFMDSAEEIAIRLIHEMKARTESAGARFIVAPVALADRKWIDKLRESNIEVVDCDVVHLEDEQLHLSDGHPNEQWNELFAGCLASYLRAQSYFKAEDSLMIKEGHE